MRTNEVTQPFKYEKIPLDTLQDKDKKKRRKASDSWGTIKRVWGYLAKRKLLLSLVLLMVLISSGLSLLGPYLVGISIDEFIYDKRTDGIFLLLLLLGLVFLFQSLSV